jgi:hypothetical protein
MSTAAKKSLREAFELWAASYWAIPLDRTYMPEYDAYVDETLQSAWSAYKAATLAQQEVIDELRGNLMDSNQYNRERW